MTREERRREMFFFFCRKVTAMPKELTSTEKALHRKKVAMGECITQVIHHLELAQESLLDAVLYSGNEQVSNLEAFHIQINNLKADVQQAFRTSLTAVSEQEDNMFYGGNGVSYQQKNRV